MRFWTSSFLGALALGTVGCLQVLGLGDYREGAGGSGATGGTSGKGGGASTGTKSTSSSSGTGGAGSCTPNMQEPCYDGDPLTKNVGNCRDGTHTCLADGSAFGTCDAQVLPAAEICTTTGDEDCDGYSCSEVMWLKDADSTGGHSLIRAAVHPGDGTIFVSAAFDGGFTLNTASLTDAGGGDAGLLRLNKDGSVIWANRFGDGQAQGFGPLVVDGMGRAYVTGRTASAFMLGNIAVSPGLFVAQFDASGAPTWVTNCGGDPTKSSLSHLGLTPDGVVLHGQLAGTTTVSCGGGPVLNPASGKAFLVRLGANGAHQWSKLLPLGGNAMAVDSTGSSVIGGAITATVDFGSGPLVPTGGALGSATFLAKFDGTGAPLWSGTFGDKGLGVGVAGLAVDQAGDIYAAGQFGGTMKFGTGFLGQPIMSDGGTDLFVAKVGGAGNAKWARRIGDAAISVYTQFQYGRDVAVRGNELLIFGDGDLQVDGMDLMTSGFVAKFAAADGQTSWTRGVAGAFGGPHGAIGPEREVVITAQYLGTVTIGTDTAMCGSCVISLDYGSFIARMGG